jgi:hypothetical protein
MAVEELGSPRLTALERPENLVVAGLSTSRSTLGRRHEPERGRSAERGHL